MQMMDDGVAIAFTRYTPDGAAPPGGWPAVVALHGLAGTRGSIEAILPHFANAGYSVLSYDARGHGESGGDVTLAGPREVADLRAVRNAFAGRPDVSDTKVGAWGISYGGGQVWNALAAGVPFAAAQVVETWTSLYDALWPQNLARSGIVAGFAASVAARSPLITSLRDAAVQSTNPAGDQAADGRALGAAEGRLDQDAGLPLPGPSRLRIRPQPGDAGVRGSRRPQEALRRQLRAHALDVSRPRQRLLPRAGHRLVRPLPQRHRERRRGEARGDREAGLGLGAHRARPAAGDTAVGARLRRHHDDPRHRARLPSDTARPSTARDLGERRRDRHGAEALDYPRLVVTVLAGNRVVSQGGVKPRAGLNRVQLANYCVFVPKGTRLRVTVGPSSPAGQIAYLGFAGVGSATIGPIRIQLPTLLKRCSG